MIFAIDKNDELMQIFNTDIDETVDGNKKENPGLDF